VKVLFDQMYQNLAHHLKTHEVTRSLELGWQELKNGDLLDAPRTKVSRSRSRPIATSHISKTWNTKLAIVVLPLVTGHNYNKVSPML